MSAWDDLVAAVKSLESNGATLGTNAKFWKGKYDAVNADLVTANQTIATLQSELATAQAAVGTPDGTITPLTTEVQAAVQTSADDASATAPTN